MSKKGMILTVLVTGLVDAVAQDEKENGHDIASGIIGEHTSNWLRNLAEDISEEV